MKYPAQTLTALLLGTTLMLAATPVLAQSTTPAPDAPAQATDDGPDDDSEEGMGWGRRHGGGHGKGHGQGHGKGQGGRHGGHAMMVIDANADGVISADEAASLVDGMFMRHDQNRDDVLDETEFTTPPGRHGGMRGWFGWGADAAEAVQNLRKEKFAALDTNKDAKLSKAEFFAEAQQKLAAADADKDGKVTPWEFRALPRM